MGNVLKSQLPTLKWYLLSSNRRKTAMAKFVSIKRNAKSCVEQES